MLSSNKLTIRSMTRNELDLAVEWAAQEGWNPGLFDADSFYAADPDGYFMAFDGTDPIGSISAVAYDGAFGFVGFFIVRPDYRGHSVGIELGRWALRHLGERNIGIDGVEKKIKNYESFGFNLAYYNIRYEGIAHKLGVSPEITELSHAGFPKILSYDRSCFPADRSRFLSRWIAQAQSKAFGIIRNNSLAGYGVIRPCRKGYKIGPLFADSTVDANNLYAALSASVPSGSQVYLDVPQINPAAVALAEGYFMKPVFKTARMYNKAAPGILTDRIFGVTSFELG